jgi:hypothetical protein
MLRFGRSVRLCVSAVLASSCGLLLMSAPAQADPDPCALQFEVATQDVIIGPHGALTGAQETRGLAFDRCAGDGRFDDSLTYRYLGYVNLRDGAWSGVTDFTPNAYTTGGWVFTGLTHVAYDRNSARGRAEFGVWMTDGRDHWAFATSCFYVRRDVKMTFYADPEPVTKGQPITVSGVVKRLTFSPAGVAKYVPYVNKTVDIYWDPKGPGADRRVALLTTDADGSYSKKFTSTVDGVWRGMSRQTDRHAHAEEPGDFVDVR